ncbi:MAG TPA: PilZ domain-containing protein [Verrucomicrobiae bacterium]|nr:PilZ domain-containing protein [Verrucomicrobiae bacterium]
MADSEGNALASLEAPTMVRAGNSPPAMAIVEHASHSECRMRSVSMFDINERLEFALSVHGAPRVALTGTIVSRKQNGARWAYLLALRTTPAQAEAIAAATEKARERSAEHTPAQDAPSGLVRAAVRIPVTFDVHYTLLGSTGRIARATNISVGGVLMNTRDELAVGASIEMQIPLDSDRVSAKGRIVAHQLQSPNYNVAFYDITDEARDTITRFIESHTKAA